MRLAFFAQAEMMRHVPAPAWPEAGSRVRQGQKLSIFSRCFSPITAIPRCNEFL
jgi:hypothetical protein